MTVLLLLLLLTVKGALGVDYVRLSVCRQSASRIHEAYSVHVNCQNNQREYLR